MTLRSGVARTKWFRIAARDGGLAVRPQNLVARLCGSGLALCAEHAEHQHTCLAIMRAALRPLLLRYPLPRSGRSGRGMGCE